MKSAVWLPGAGWTARHLLWVPQLSSSQRAVTPTVAARRPHICFDRMCGGLLEWSLKCTSHWHVQQSSIVCECGDGLKNLALLDFSKSVLAHAVNRSWSRLTASARTLMLMLVKSMHRMRWRSNAIDSGQQRQWERYSKSSNVRFLGTSLVLHVTMSDHRNTSVIQTTVRTYRKQHSWC